MLVSFEPVSDLFLDLSISLFRSLVSLVLSKRRKQEYTSRNHSQQNIEPSTQLRYIVVAGIEPRPRRWNARTNHCAKPVPTLYLRDSLEKYLTSRRPLILRCASSLKYLVILLSLYNYNARATDTVFPNPVGSI